MLMPTKPSHTSSSTKGFTIVELLIVIVVIAILAAITVVAYNGIQQRANNTAIIDTASKTVRMVQAYVAANGVYPYAQGAGSGWVCVTSAVICTWDEGSAVPANTTFNNNIATVGTLPRSVPTSGSLGNGVQIFWGGTFVMDGISRPFMVIYWLNGINQQCGIPGVVVQSGSTLTLSSTGNSASNSAGGKTLCRISIAGPSA